MVEVITNHSYIATAIAVIFRLVKIAIHNSGEKGSRNAIKGISDFCCGAAKNDTPLKKYGALKSITSLRALETLSAANDI